MRLKRFFCALLLCGLAAHGVGQAPADAPAIRVEGTRFVDRDGREVVLRGFHVGSKDLSRNDEVLLDLSRGGSAEVAFGTRTLPVMHSLAAR